MVVQKRNSIIKQIKDISVSSTLGLALLGSVGILQSCGTNKQEYETVYTKGIATYITETEQEGFKIVDEKVVEAGESRAYITYLDGRTEMLSMEEVKRRVAADTSMLPASSDVLSSVAEADSVKTINSGSITKEEESHVRRSYYPGVGTLLWYSAMGNMMGRTAAPNPGFYSSPSVYEKSQAATHSYRSSRTTRPISSKTGFFGRSSSAGSRSFGG